jgi:hypothetical protein
MFEKRRKLENKKSEAFILLSSLKLQMEVAKTFVFSFYIEL